MGGKSKFLFAALVSNIRKCSSSSQAQRIIRFTSVNKVYCLRKVRVLYANGIAITPEWQEFRIIEQGFEVIGEKKGRL